MADDTAGRAQHLYFKLLAGQLACALAGATLLGVGNALAPLNAGGRLRQAAAVALLLSVILLLTSRALRHDVTWWDARAVAESIKSSAWRYMMRATPFANASGDEAVEESFTRQIVEARMARPGIATSLERHREEGTQELSPAMRAKRALPLAERKKDYLAWRLEDQKRWYGGKARSHDRAREAFFAGTLVLQVLALITVFFDWRPGGLNVVSLLVALSASVTAWAQAKRHEESAQAYALARHELDVMETRLSAAADEGALSAAVAETEEAISREHTMWMARRNR